MKVILRAVLSGYEQTKSKGSGLGAGRGRDYFLLNYSIVIIFTAGGVYVYDVCKYTCVCQDTHMEIRRQRLVWQVLFFFLPAESSYGSHLIFNNTVFKNGQICPKNRSILGNLFITFKVHGVL